MHGSNICWFAFGLVQTLAVDPKDVDDTVALQIARRSNDTTRISPETALDTLMGWGPATIDCAKEAFASNVAPYMCKKTKGVARCKPGWRSYSYPMGDRCCKKDWSNPPCFNGPFQSETLGWAFYKTCDDGAESDFFGHCVNECPDGWDECGGVICAAPGKCSKAFLDEAGFALGFGTNAALNYFGSTASFTEIAWSQFVGYVDGKIKMHVATQACKNMVSGIKGGKVDLKKLKPQFTDLAWTDFDLFGFNTLFEELNKHGCSSQHGCKDDDTKTSYGKQCCGQCAKWDGTDYNWCRKTEGGWDYCSVNSKTTTGMDCLTSCDYQGEDYAWCWTKPWKEDWDYCVKDITKDWDQGDR